MSKPPLFVTGMHGMGDCLHQRAIMRTLMRDNDVWLGSSWVSMYHDLIAQGLKVVKRPTPLRTQNKNATREAALFSKEPVPVPCRKIAVSYSQQMFRTHGGVLQGMFGNLGLDYAGADFRLPIKPDWFAAIDRQIMMWRPKKPILVYRPLVIRKEFHYNGRNPDYAVYARLFEEIRDRFFVVSVADLQPNIEWIVGEKFMADREFHRGELPFEHLAALFARSSLVFASPGFSCVLAQATSTPLVCVFGGFENSKSFSAGAKFAPYCGIDVDNPCDCYQTSHKCDKTIDGDRASLQLKEFMDGLFTYDTTSEVQPGTLELSEQQESADVFAAG